MKNILGLDLGTNSIGWAIVSKDDEGKYLQKINLGSRIIPMSQDIISKFDSGVTESQTAIRTQYRGVRRIRERSLLRRERLFRILNILGFLPEHFASQIGWDPTQTSTFGKFINTTEPKIAWYKDKTGKMQFLFKDSFSEMLSDFAINQPALVKDGKKVPYDWTIYYLRKKALTKAITKEELAWIILNFNQKRGYYQLRGEEEDNSKNEKYYKLKVLRVEETDEKRGKETWYNVYLEKEGFVYRRSSSVSLADWVGKTKEFIVTTQLDADGSPKVDKDGNIKRSFRAPSENDWALVKKRTEELIDKSKETVGSYIYDTLLSIPDEKIRGSLVSTVERKFYKAELIRILAKQAEFIPELSNKDLFEKCVFELYRNNENHRKSVLRNTLSHFIVNDIIFYQRPLKSKKSQIADCPYEYYEYVNKETGEIKKQSIKCIARSNPYFQEIRLWQFIQNLRIIDNETIDNDLTSKYLPNAEAYTNLYDWLNDKKEVKQDELFSNFFYIKKPKGKNAKYPVRWNYVEDKSYPCNTTRYEMIKALKKADCNINILDDKQVEYRLWHLLYSVDDKAEITSALKKFAEEYNLSDIFVTQFLKIKPFDKDYGAYSEKAIKKLLTVMRIGKYWKIEDLSESVKERINTIISQDIDEKMKIRIGRLERTFEKIEDFHSLPIWMACYVVYGRFTEVSTITKWNTPDSMLGFIKSFKHGSLRNPIVEQCLLETLRTVHNIWEQYGNIDEIHVELGRNMKTPADKRKAMTLRNVAQENTNLRIKGLLMELKNSGAENVRPYSPMQQEILKIYEDGALMTLKQEDTDYNDIIKISSMASPSNKEMVRYKLWLEQKYRSPYTGKPISLSKLFTSAYQIEHIIPQARYFDDSLSNKVICEAEVNGLKTNMLAHEFIGKCGGQVVKTSLGDSVKVFNVPEYEEFVQSHYAGNRSKIKKLMLDDIPMEFLNRQMNDSRYISKVIIGLLSNIVREEGEQEATSKHVIPCTGGVTDRLKKDWGLNDIWNKIVYNRFERMNAITNSNEYGHWDNKDGKRVFQTTMPIEFQKGFNKKRIDHRHHAMDALVIACASRNIVGFLNNESAADTKRRNDLKALLCDKGRVIRKPWDSFTVSAYKALSSIIVSFRNNVRIINKASNYYEHYNNGGKKEIIPQNDNVQWAIRKPLHKETVFGHVNLRKKKVVTFSKALDDVNNIVDKDLRKHIVSMFCSNMDKKKIVKAFKTADFKYKDKDISKLEIFYFTDSTEPMVAVRKPLDDSFDEKRIASITDTGIQKILLNYLNYKGGDSKVAFTPESIAEMNKRIEEFNDGVLHKPIYKVRCVEPMGKKYAVGVKGNKSSKFVEAQSGTNLYFAIYEDKDGNRFYDTPQLNMVIERLKQGLSPVEEVNANGLPLKFYLSPNDLVYVPTEEEINNNIEEIDNCRIYKMINSTGKQCFFVQEHVANSIVDKVEYTTLNKMERAIDGTMIKSVCWKLIVDNLGNIIKVIK